MADGREVNLEWYWGGSLGACRDSTSVYLHNYVHALSYVRITTSFETVYLSPYIEAVYWSSYLTDLVEIYTYSYI